jgi:hypothetical protein
MFQPKLNNTIFTLSSFQNSGKQNQLYSDVTGYIQRQKIKCNTLCNIISILTIHHGQEKMHVVAKLFKSQI